MRWVTFTGAAVNGLNLVTNIVTGQHAWAVFSLIGLLVCGSSFYFRCRKI